MKKLWYTEAAKMWNEALPIGNGRIGGMVYGDVWREVIAINEDTLWSGYPRPDAGSHSMADVENVRRLVAEKKYAEADKATSQMMFGAHVQAYFPFGALHLDFLDIDPQAGGSVFPDHTVHDYRRELDLENAVATTTFTVGNNHISETSFVSLTEDCLYFHVHGDANVRLRVSAAPAGECRMYVENGILYTEGRCPTDISQYTTTVTYDPNEESVCFRSAVGIYGAGYRTTSGGSEFIAVGSDFTIVFSIATSFAGFDKMPISEGREYKNRCKALLDAATAIPFEEALARHTAKYHSYFDRVSFSLAGEDRSDLPTDKRIGNFAVGNPDNGIIPLLFDFGRYLTISSSLPGTQATNLQGIWSDELIAPWHSNYTVNINTEMNYWHVETVALPECHLPLFDMLKDLAAKGNSFGLRGWNTFHNTDLWRFHTEATSNPMWGFWPMGGAWFCRHIWEHYLHTRDKSFLAEYYPVMTGAADFMLDWSYQDTDGRRTTCPSTSPENEFIYHGTHGHVAEGVAMDLEILHDLFDKTVQAGEILGKDITAYRKALAELKPIGIADDGRIREWSADMEENEPGHRHISHLYGIYPADEFTGDEWKKVCAETLRGRMENGGGGTGWSNAWVAAVYARLGNAEGVAGCLRTMFRRSIYKNFFDRHPPFQIDGNFGITAAITEALMQSHTGKIELLPALPAEWQSGEVKGFVARTGEVVSFRWENGKVVEKKIEKR